MKVPINVYASDALIKKMKEDRTLKQAMNVASLPGVLPNVSVMPDGHEGYGFPIGGVAAFSAEDGLVSPGGIGYDINCGIRLLKTNLKFKEVKPLIEKLTASIFKAVPSGVGSKGAMDLSKSEFLEIITRGVGWAHGQGYATEYDLNHIEENGSMKTSHGDVSQRALSRGLKQIGTLGAGNHFIEIQRVSSTFEHAKEFGIEKDQVVIMIHTGSRGFGHQIASDYISLMMRSQNKFGFRLPDKELAAAPLKSKEGEKYINAMRCAVNFAFVNRQIITYFVRQVFEEYLGDTPKLLYDVAHNIGKFEKHKEEIFIHRKGATRAFGPGRTDLPDEFKNLGQPVIIPGSMGTASYVLIGKGNPDTFESTCHGAGRVMSRSKARRSLSSNKIIASLKRRGITVMTNKKSGVSEEAPEAYKDIDEVVGVVKRAGISDTVAKLLPMGVVKG
ncbi:MAG: RtcB family protein [Candidatus Altiarchaeota archaeon]|nr:RtcB family protein [Candidatus Altiarchaeota archaeon]